MVGGIVVLLWVAYMLYKDHCEKEAETNRYIKDCCDRMTAINDNYNKSMKELHDKYGDNF